MPSTVEKRQYNREYYRKNHGRLRAYARAYSKAHPKDRRRYRVRRDAIRWYKATKGCADCGEKDPIVLSFDHLPEYEKSFTVRNDGGGRVLSVVWEEIQKCEVVCMNCHLRRTHSRYHQ